MTTMTKTPCSRADFLLMIRAAMREVGHGEWADAVRICAGDCPHDNCTPGNPGWTSHFHPTPEQFEAFKKAQDLVFSIYDPRKGTT